jgi:hypothetical protein
MERGFQLPRFETNRVPAIFRPVLLGFTVIYAVAGLALFLFPEQASDFWPWSLTPLTARVIGGWWLSGAALQIMLAQQKTLATARVGLFANSLVSFLLLTGALYHFKEFDGPQISIWLYLLLSLFLGGFSVYSWIQSNSART